eukprot:GHVN01021395.1.p1 GENE.GHVN01021395.1~~GHVN01021395.1.p1  ORF type:complete len:123 (+),score=43.58 GHVN01021395.1:112-480(+)
MFHINTLTHLAHMIHLTHLYFISFISISHYFYFTSSLCDLTHFISPRSSLLRLTHLYFTSFISISPHLSLFHLTHLYFTSLISLSPISISPHSSLSCSFYSLKFTKANKDNFDADRLSEVSD